MSGAAAAPKLPAAGTEFLGLIAQAVHGVTRGPAFAAVTWSGRTWA